MATIDLSELAVDRSPAPSRAGGRRGQLWTRYVLPSMILAGFTTMILWTSWDLLFPPRRVTVTPVVLRQATHAASGGESFKAAGWVEPRPSLINVPSLTTGVVSEVLVVEGDTVTSGQTIARLVSENAELSLRRAKAERAQREAELDSTLSQQTAAKARLENPQHLKAPLADAEATLVQVTSKIEALPFEIQRAESRRDFAKLDFEGKQKAAAAVRERSIQAAQSELDSANALLDELKARSHSLQKEAAALIQRRDALQQQLDLQIDEHRAVRDADAAVRIARAQLEQAIIGEQEAQLRLDRCIIQSPCNGRVHRVLVTAGSTLKGRELTGELSGESVATLYQPETLQVRIDVRFNDLRKVELKQSVEIQSPAFDGTASGNVISIGSQADIQKNTLQVRVALNSPPVNLRPEMLVDATFLEPERASDQQLTSTTQRLFIPKELVQSNNGSDTVWVADRSRGIAVRRTIETGEETKDGLLEVSNGLNIAEKLIAGDLNSLHDGDRIVVSGETQITHGASATVTSASPEQNPSQGVQTR